MENDFRVAHHTEELSQIANVSQDKLRALRDVSIPAAVDLRREVVVDADFVAGLQQCVGSVRTDEPRAAGNEDPFALQMEAPDVVFARNWL